ncbi:ATP-binding cassette domain-containing protein [Facklamia sp. DSM 111018]|uniref:ATP-binding cassette domain-containing protein n=1 Tax=Facklamia lactis TaxID=2749967 RepID=A0ABS0LPG3_9LACT|nr:ATP-binding cassette domain-containing protein [Facklamia lactis]MBG9986043.1 ATP-binding cassette domain-containing protein [Facklamia lactis]
MFEVKDLCKSFMRDGETISPVDHLNFTLNQGEMAVIMGKSGVGKTTFLNLLALFLKADQGDILYQKKSIIELDDQQASLFRNQELAYLTQKVETLSSLNVLENVMLPSYISSGEKKGVNEIRQRAVDLLEKLGIGDLKDQAVRQLSGGEKKRVALARALINQPKILLLDEPTVSLDEATSLELRDLLVDLNKQGMGMLIVTHDPIFKDLKQAKLFHMVDGHLLESTSKLA